MILVTGASGHLAQLVLADLSARGASVVGASRSPAQGHRRMDFDQPASIDLRGISTLVLVSAGYAEDDQVISRHRAVLDAATRDGVGHVVYTSLTIARHAAVIDAAVRSGVGHIVYTSVAGEGDHLAFALAHRATERLVRDSGLDWTILRNGLYAELFGGLLTWADGQLESPFGDGALSAVPRADLATAAATVAASPTRHHGRTYELVGAPITADDVARRLGVEHRAVPLADYRERLNRSPELMAFQPPMLTSIASSIRHGFMDGTSPDLMTLLDRSSGDSLTVAADIAGEARSVRA
jgi:NAD(P)H dehydrogenase (quinone)